MTVRSSAIRHTCRWHLSLWVETSRSDLPETCNTERQPEVLSERLLFIFPWGVWRIQSTPLFSQRCDISRVMTRRCSNNIHPRVCLFHVRRHQTNIHHTRANILSKYILCDFHTPLFLMSIYHYQPKHWVTRPTIISFDDSICIRLRSFLCHWRF